MLLGLYTDCYRDLFLPSLLTRGRISGYHLRNGFCIGRDASVLGFRVQGLGLVRVSRLGSLL